jgi:hypothetical protein
LELFSPGADYLAIGEQALAKGQVEGRESLDGLRAVLSGEKPEFRATYLFRSADGSRRHYLLTVSPRLSGDGVVVVHTDMTERGGEGGAGGEPAGGAS